MSVSTLNELFVHTLKDMYYTEKLLVKKLPKMAKEATDSKLSHAFTSHLEETKGHVERLERIFEILDKRAQAKKCPAIDGITKEAEETVKEIDDDATRDAALIGGAGAAEHYEITRYGTLIAWAQELGLAAVIPLLQKTLEEEKAADAKLTQLAEGKLNRMAA